MLVSSHPSALSALPLLRVRDLSVSYLGDQRQRVPALHKVDFDIWPGEIVGILGESGAGKSTLATSLLRLRTTGTESCGSISFQGQDLLQLDESSYRALRGAQIALIAQEPGLSLNFAMRVGDQVAEVIRAHSKVNSKTRREQSEAVLREVGFSNVERVHRAYPHQLSGGELHRIAIAQAIVCRPKLVIADEPTRSLDVVAQAEILEVLRSTHRNSGTALILITHNPALLAGFADRVIVMYAGRILEEGPVGQVFQKPFHPYTEGLLQLFPTSRARVERSFKHLPVIPGALVEADHRSAGCIFEPRCSSRTDVCHMEAPVEEIQQDRRVSCFNYGK